MPGARGSGFSRRKSSAEIKEEDSLVTDEEKKEHISALRREAGYKKIDYLTIDVDNIPERYFSWLRNSMATKAWAKSHGYSDTIPLDDACVHAYVVFRMAEEHKKATDAQERRDFAEATRTKALETHEQAVQKRINAYLERIIEPQPQDIAVLENICAWEVQQETLRREISLLNPGDGESFGKLSLLNAQLKMINDSYLFALDKLNLTKKQRDSANEGKSVAEVVIEQMSAAEAWMAKEMHFVICQCGVELLWLWAAFEHVHDPKPFFSIVQCICGRVNAIGDVDFAKEEIGKAIARGR